MLSYLFRIIILALIAQTPFITQTCFSSTQFLTISDIHYSYRNTPGDGHDTDDTLLQSAMTKFSQLSKNADFIIHLGDIPTHGKYPAIEKEGYEKIVFQSLYQADTTAKPMFYVTGNNDSLLSNYGPFSYNGHSPLDVAEDWSGACAHCENLMINDEHMRDGGYYSSYVIPGNNEVILIALNSIQFTDLSSRRPPPYPNQKEDATTQLLWLEKELSQHYAKQLLIAMHIPPGTDYLGKSSWHSTYLQQFIALLKKYRSRYHEITLLSSHSHMDEVRKLSLDQTHNIYLFSTPSISRIHHNNPAMKVFQLDSNYSLSNFTTFYTKSDESWLDDPNLDDHYSAIGEAGIFPQCQQALSLANCLDSLSQDSVCADIENGKFYGVKSDLVDNSLCRTTYEVKESFTHPAPMTGVSSDLIRA